MLGIWAQRAIAAPRGTMAPMPDSAPPTPLPQRLRRLWQPHNGLFWLMLLFNGLSTGMAWFLANAAAGMLLLWLLWRST